LISRIFYPIGQGAFYAEKHSNFTIVYDCGNWKKTNLSERVVRQSFTSSDVIDVLFISHFDWDHISRVGTLKDTVGKIKCVVLPLLHNKEKILISNMHRVLGYSTQTFINDPELYFGNEVKIIYVRSTEDGSEEMNPEAPLSVEGVDTEIESGTSLFVGDEKYNWCFIPYNIFNSDRSKDLIKKLKNIGFDIDKLQNDPDYTIRNINSTSEKNKIKKAYNDLDGKINQNSMILYSGCREKPKVKTYVRWRNKDLNGGHHYYPIFHCYLGKVACIYTGDVDLCKIKLETLFRSYWEYVGTIQVPHHGSIHNFDASLQTSDRMVFPISYGITNTYGHPSYNVINQIVEKGGFVLSVTEILDSGAIQVIESDVY